MKKALLAAAAAAVLVLPAAAQAQSMFTPGVSTPGVYIGIEGGGNWLLNNNNYNMDIGYAAGGVVGSTLSVRVSNSRACSAATTGAAPPTSATCSAT